LGQTVNSYRHASGGVTTRLADLLYQLHDIAGLKRLKFVTNYPKDMTNSLLEAVRDLPKCSPYLHVPAQSGSNRMLDRMKRGYTVEDYREMMARIREALPQSAVSSDFIVGFCGETEEDFQLTCDLLRECRFKNSFIFKYSERPGTKGAELYPDDVPEAVKKRRNNELLAMQNQISSDDNERLLGRTVDVLVEGPSKRAHHDSQSPEELDPAGTQWGEEAPRAGIVQLIGRTHDDRIVVFDGNLRQAGQTIAVAIYDSNSHTLFGAVATEHVGPEVHGLTFV
jgi:tRNA-2-methylthio-N6-dimethylallyladenosine synthase